MEFLVAILYGVIQGLCEFLPISSSGHLALLNLFVPAPSSIVFFSIVLHIATLISVCVCMRTEIKDLFKKENRKKLILICISVIPAGVVGVFLGGVVEDSFNSLYSILFGFLLTIVLLCICDYLSSKKEAKFKQPNLKTTAFMGLMQALAVFPGLSRSGSTISAGVFSGLNKQVATSFSFLMSIPVILGSLFYEVIKIFKNGIDIMPSSILPITAGFITAFVSGMIAIDFMLKLVKTKTFKPFIAYLTILSAAIVCHLIFK